jgi:hypothetical protein
MLERILTIGLNDTMPSYKQRRVRTANSVALILIGALVIPFTIISWIYFPSIAFSPLLGLGVCGIYFALAKAGHTRFARFLLAAGPAFAVAHYNVALCGPEGNPLATLRFISMIFIIMSFVVVDTREKGLLIATVLGSGLPILLLSVAKQWVVLDPALTDERLTYITLLEEGWMSYVSYFVAIVAASSALLGLSMLGRSAEQESEAARQEAEKKTEVIQQEKQVADETLSKLEEVQRVENQRRWISEGITQLTNLTRTQSDESADVLYDRIITHFVKFLEANQGGLYLVRREEEVTICLEACYAYRRKKYRQKTIAPGEGLVGQVFLEQAPVRLNELPEDYVTITSGLGKATPRSLVIVPLMVNDVVEGILELATFKEIEDHQLEFLEQAGESLAAFIQMNRINVKTRVLLAEAQQQTEEMRAQEEEMRQNLEELAATQEEMHRKEQAYQDKIAELEGQLSEA